MHNLFLVAFVAVTYRAEPGIGQAMQTWITIRSLFSSLIVDAMHCWKVLNQWKVSKAVCM